MLVAAICQPLEVVEQSGTLVALWAARSQVAWLLPCLMIGRLQLLASSWCARPDVGLKSAMVTLYHYCAHLIVHLASHLCQAHHSVAPSHPPNPAFNPPMEGKCQPSWVDYCGRLAPFVLHRTT